jgi:hypothetical protein
VAVTETLRTIAERYGVEYSPRWLGPACRVTPNRWNNHTACNHTLCTCGCHQRQEQLGPSARPVPVQDPLFDATAPAGAAA